MHHLLDTRLRLQVKCDHWLFKEIIAKVVEQADLDYPNMSALGKSIRRWAKRHKVIKRFMTQFLMFNSGSLQKRYEPQSLSHTSISLSV